jgi:5'-3' exonuclease
MGIPSYFSHIIRNYSNIIRNLKYFNDSNIVLHHLFMDCNSIIYDSVRSVEYLDNDTEFEEKVINIIIKQIENYIHTIKPTKTVFIAFDGVAPFAKMEQQRTRRHKNLFLNQLDFTDEKTNNSKWDTTAITPGTKFMNKLSEKIEYAFSYVNKKYGIEQVIVSTSNESGEGEHKLFEFLRNNELSNDNVALYGLDSDLIMLSIFHIYQTNNIYIFREAPEFVKNMLPVGSVYNDTDPYFLDINLLTNNIIDRMDCIDNSIVRVYDYVFLCFFLGNDFLPHFPAMNIRTHGIDTILDIYRLQLGKTYNASIIDTNYKINWRNLRKVIEKISAKEKDFLLQEYSYRKKFDSFKFKEETFEDKEKLFQNTPIIYRSQEKYISPDLDFWETRYYKTLFKHDVTDKFIKDVCNNYMEGLEWVLKYYTKGCVDWRWKYNYSYPPLFKDLINFIPHFEMTFIKENNNMPFHPYTQLSYVLPITNHRLIPDKISKFLKYNYREYYSENYKFEWAFCRYFWESHPILPDIPLDVLENWNIQINSYVTN